MPVPPYAQWMLAQESRALLTRLARVKHSSCRNNTAGGRTSAPVADSDRELSDWWTPASKGVGGSVSGMARFTACGREQCRRGTTPVQHPAASIQLGADAVRSFQRRDHTAQ